MKWLKIKTELQGRNLYEYATDDFTSLIKDQNDIAENDWAVCTYNIMVTVYTK